MSEVLANVVESQLGDVNGAYSTVELLGGYLDRNKVLHTTATVRGLTGHEEEMLGSKSVPAADKTDMLLRNCVESLGDVTAKQELAAALIDLPMGDRIALLFGIRMATHGDQFSFEKICPNSSCKKKKLHTVSLLQLEGWCMEEPEIREFVVTLPSKKVAKCHVATGRDERNRDDLMKRYAAKTVYLMMRVDEIDGVEASAKMLMDLSAKDRDMLRGYLDDKEPGIESVVDIKCPYCTAEFEVEVDPTSPGFFSPSAYLSSLNKRSSTSRKRSVFRL